MSVGVNPLVVARTGGATNEWSGVYLAEDIQLLHQGVKSGSWVDMSLGGTGAALDTLGLITDPLGTLASWGVAWLLDHVKPLSEALDKLAGDPAQITANAQTWRNVASQLSFAAGDYRNAVDREVSSWSGTAATAYRAHADNRGSGIKALSQAAETMASIVEGAGMLVALVRTLVRDAIAELVSVLAVRLWEWLAEEAGLARRHFPGTGRLKTSSATCPTSPPTRTRWSWVRRRTAGCSPSPASRPGSGSTEPVTVYRSRLWWNLAVKESSPRFRGLEHRHDH